MPAPIAAGVAGLAWITIAGVLYRPEGSAALGVGCPFKQLTGLDCPGCGSTRALGALTRLDVGAALDHNVLVPGAVVFLVVSWGLWTLSRWRVQPTSALVRGPRAIIAIGVLFVAFAVVRNLEFAAWLASGLGET
ncbi:MAG TPA: DUF2752 domain-containing protein [Ilumatobacteraceae bacterium]|nr:DUF2752 domain-containing protein [Ilumatobacteraceae bacterium]